MLNKLKYYRQDFGYKQRELSLKLQVPEQRICLWETGRQKIPDDIAVHLGDIFGCEPSEFSETLSSIPEKS
jgi:DNA-binding XRE family transcriptional regulator